MSTLNDLKEASFRGVKFFYKSSYESEGFKVAEHIYPGSDNFKIQQLGHVPRRFSIDAIVRFDDRDSFDSALRTGGTGILSHPMYGIFLAKIGGTYTKSDTVDSLGLYAYTIPFVVEVGLIEPTISGISLSLINIARSGVITNVSNFVKSQINIFSGG